MTIQIVRTAELARDITAEHLAMDSAEPGEGYAKDHVIGPAGTSVTIIDDTDDTVVEVEGFANDPYACGFISRSDLVGFTERA